MKQLLYLLAILCVSMSFAQNKPIKIEERKIEPVEIKAVDLESEIVTVPVEESDYDVPFAVVEKIPMFEDCEDIDNEQNKKCFDLKMKEHIAKNLKIPNLSESDTNIKTYIMFVIKNDGSISNIKTRCRNSINCEAYEKEAVRIIKLLPNFKPATQRGKAVNVSYAIPIIFNQKIE